MSLRVKSMDFLGILDVIFVLLLTTVNCQQPIVSTNTISAGGTFSVSCDASRVTSLDSRVTNITTLLISRTVAGDTNVQNLASYSSITIESISQNFTSIPPGRNWSIIFNGVNGGVSNRDRMTNVLTVNDGMCSDAGTYQCSVTYVLNQALQPPVINQQNVTAVAGISDFSLTVFPDRLGEPYGEENITFTCQFYGPETARPVWELWTINSVYEGYTLSSTLTNAVTDPPVLQSNTGGCVRYFIKSTLQVQLTSNDNLNMYRCRDNNNIQSSNITISVGGSVFPASSQKAPEFKVGTVVGDIVGGIVGGILVIVAAVFIVFLLRRKGFINIGVKHRNRGAAMHNGLPVKQNGSHQWNISQELPEYDVSPSTHYEEIRDVQSDILNNFTADTNRQFQGNQNRAVEYENTISAF